MVTGDGTKCRSMLPMARWEPNASRRLVLAALDLFAEQGYEDTTVIQIAERAGLTKSTFFRYFPDKREVLFGGETMAELLAHGVTTAPETAAPLDAVAHALDAVGREAFTPDRRAFTARRQAVITANQELREREALKGLALTAAMEAALRRRGVPELVASVAAHLGALALAITFERWTDTTDTTGTGEFGELARQALDELRTASALLTDER